MFLSNRKRPKQNFGRLKMAKDLESREIPFTDDGDLHTELFRSLLTYSKETTQIGKECQSSVVQRFCAHWHIFFPPKCLTQWGHQNNQAFSWQRTCTHLRDVSEISGGAQNWNSLTYCVMSWPCTPWLFALSLIEKLSCSMPFQTLASSRICSKPVSLACLRQRL